MEVWMERWLVLAIWVGLIGCGGKSQVEEPRVEEVITTQPMIFIEVEKKGKISIELYPEDAPKNVENLMRLARSGFYDGLRFHRVVPGFVVQGGDPKGDGTGDAGYLLADEISPRLRHLKGTVAMANRGPNTNSCQFYICLEPQPHLDGGYTIVGQVVEGMEVVEKIEQGDVMKKVWVGSRAQAAN